MVILHRKSFLASKEHYNRGEKRTWSIICIDILWVHHECFRNLLYVFHYAEELQIYHRELPNNILPA